MSRQLNICILAQSHLSNNSRVVKEADALATDGHAVSLVCGDYTDWGRQNDRAFAGRRWTKSAVVRFGPLADSFTRTRQAALQKSAKLASRLAHPTVEDGSAAFRAIAATFPPTAIWLREAFIRRARPELRFAKQRTTAI
jgi:hypothetical protein